ncbi:MAG: hypothetical protein Q8L81_10210 [Bacteroidota bacterium]|nr:hypothetical protein [Bacteroidota bacterium]
MIFYLTVNEAPSGIFSSQVIDVVKFLNKNFETEARLLAFISLRGYFANRKRIKNELPNAIVLPMYPKMQNWKKNNFLLSLFYSIYKPEKIIARSVIATKLALAIRDKNKGIKVIYDGRGAIEAEWREYKVITDNELLNSIASYEKEVILNSDNRIAVSNALVDHWKTNFSYKETKHVIIPCTLNNAFEAIKISDEAILKKRKELGLKAGDTVFVYSGSVAGWQSFNLLAAFIESVLQKSILNKIVFFSPGDPNIEKLQKAFPEQTICKHLDSNKVADYLMVGDYGLLIRENSVTNKVASPVKYAEYLAGGLKVIISPELGDYTQLSSKKKWGYLYTEFNDAIIKPGVLEKQKISTEAIQFFSKQNYKEQYLQLIST